MNSGLASDLAAFKRGYKTALMHIYQGGIALEVAAPHVPAPAGDNYQDRHWQKQLEKSAAILCETADTCWAEFANVPEGTLAAEYGHIQNPALKAAHMAKQERANG
jgi:hypothetical protein